MLLAMTLFGFTFSGREALIVGVVIVVVSSSSGGSGRDVAEPLIRRRCATWDASRC